MARGGTTRRSDGGVDTNPEFARIDDQYDYDETEARSPRGPSPRPIKRARLGVVILAVLVTEAVLIGAGLNQGVSKHLQSYSRDHPAALLGRFVRSLLVLRWQLSPSGMSDLWHAELITVGIVLLLGVVLVPMVVHGAVNWLRAFIGTWMTVTVSTVVATVAALVLSDLEESRDLTSYVIPGTPTTGLSIPDRIGDAAFGPVASYAFVAGLALGLVTALVVAGIVVLSRRADPVPVMTVAAEPVGAAATPEPFFGDTPRTDRRPSSDTTPYVDPRSENDTRAYAPPAPRREDDAPTSSQRRSGVGGIAGAGAGLGYAAGTSRSDDAANSATAPDANASNETAAFPRLGEHGPSSATAADADATSELPRSAEPPTSANEPAANSAANPETDSARTAAFPMPPDDEDLGHDPHHDND